MGAQENMALLRKGFAAFAAGDMDTLNEMFADDIVWHSGGDNPLSGDYKGKEEVFGLFGKLIEKTGGTFRSEAEHVLADDDYAAALVHTHMEREGKVSDGTGMNLFRVEKGKVLEAWIFGRDTSKFDEVLS